MLVYINANANYRMKYSSIPYFASTYNCNAYGSGVYDESGQCIATTGTATGNNTLTPTGTDLFVGLFAGIALIAAAIALVIRPRRKNKK